MDDVIGGLDTSLELPMTSMIESETVEKLFGDQGAPSTESGHVRKKPFGKLMDKIKARNTTTMAELTTATAAEHEHLIAETAQVGDVRKKTRKAFFSKIG